jgi:membrane-associated protein
MPDINQVVAHWGYAGIVVVVVLGNIGLPVPEETVLALAGYLVFSGRIQLLPVLVAALVSAVVGDALGFWLGRRYGRAAVERHARWLLTPARVTQAESLIRRYGAVAVCAARFVGGLRVVAGPLAGALGLPFRSFLRGNALGAVIFVPYAVGIGYAIGYGLEPYTARVQQVLGGVGRMVLLGALVSSAALISWLIAVKVVRMGMLHAIRTRV